MALDLNKKDGDSAGNPPAGESKKTGSFNLSKETDAPKKKFNLSKDEGVGPAVKEDPQPVNDKTEGGKKSNRMLLLGGVVVVALIAIYFVVNPGKTDSTSTPTEETAGTSTGETTPPVSPASNEGTTMTGDIAATPPPPSGTPETPPPSAANSIQTAPIANQTPVLEFSPSSTAPTQLNSETVSKLVEYLNANASVNITLMGYASSEGELSYNQRLSQQRADQVKNLLVSRGIKASRITTIGKGIENPIADNGTAEGRSKNRRVEISYN